MSLIPYNEEFEKALIVGILQDPSLLPRLGSIVSSHDFYKERHKEIFGVIEDLNIDNLDSLTVEDKLTEPTKEYFRGLIRDSDSLLPGISNIIFYAETIKDKSKLRAGIDLGREMAALCYQENVKADDALEQVETMFSNFLQKRVKENLYESTKEAFKSFFDKLGSRINDESGIRTGFRAIDLIINRLEGLIILAARPSVGKAQPLTEPILTPWGFFPMGSLQVGNEVIGSNGQPTKVVGVFPQGIIPIYKVTFSDGRSTECSEDHLWFTQTHNEQRAGKKGSVKTTKEILAKLRRTDGRPDHHIPLVAPVSTKPKPYKPINESLILLDPYLMGILLGDGGFTTSIIRFTNIDTTIIEEFKKTLPSEDTYSVDGISFRIKRKQRDNTPSKTKMSLQFYALDKHHSYEKFIPEAYKTLNSDQRLALLQGLLDTDGSVIRKDTIEYSSSSPQLAKDVQDLVRSLGGIASLTSRIPHYKYKKQQLLGRTSYRVYIHFPIHNFDPFRSKIKLSKWSGTSSSSIYIKSIEYVGNKEAQCIMVDAKDSLYVTKDYILTHNTALAINIARNVSKEHPVVFFSLEQTREQIFERMLAAEAEVPLEEIRTGAFIADPESTTRLDAARERLVEAFNHFHVDERDAIPTSHVASVARQKKFEWGTIGLIVVDYLHIIRLNDGAKVDALGDAVKDLRALGKELGCPVLLLSQLNRQPDMQTSHDGEGGKVRRRPELTDLRSSGEIEQSADIVMFLHRESYYDPSGYVLDEDEIEVHVKKNRNGRIGITSLVWMPKIIKFKDL